MTELAPPPEVKEKPLGTCATLSNCIQLKNQQSATGVVDLGMLIRIFIVPPSCCSVPHTRSLEARIKEELVAQGLLDSEERPGPGGESEDEVLAELQKRQAELKALITHNRSRKQELLR